MKFHLKANDTQSNTIQKQIENNYGQKNESLRNRRTHRMCAYSAELGTLKPQVISPCAMSTEAGSRRRRRRRYHQQQSRSRHEHTLQEHHQPHDPPRSQPAPTPPRPPPQHPRERARARSVRGGGRARRLRSSRPATALSRVSRRCGSVRFLAPVAHVPHALHRSVAAMQC